MVSATARKYPDVDAQADLGLCCLHMPKDMFSHGVLIHCGYSLEAFQQGASNEYLHNICLHDELDFIRNYSRLVIKNHP